MVIVDVAAGVVGAVEDPFADGVERAALVVEEDVVEGVEALGPALVV